MIDEMIVLERLESWKACYDAEVGLEREDEEACQQIKERIHEAYRIPDTSERETELEELIIKMQKELDKNQMAESQWIDIVCELYNKIEELKENQVEVDEEFFEEWGGAFFDLDTHHMDEYIDMCREMLEEARIGTKKK